MFFDVGAMTQYGYTARAQTSCDNFRVFELLLNQAKINVNALNSYGDGMVVCLVQANKHLFLEHLIKFHGDKVNLSIENHLKMDALYVGAKNGFVEIVKLLLNSKKVNINHICDTPSRTALNACVTNTENQSSKSENMSFQNNPLSDSTSGNYDNSKHNSTGRSGDNFACFKILMKHPDIDLNILTKDKQNAFDICLSQKKYKYINWFANKIPKNRQLSWNMDAEKILRDQFKNAASEKVLKKEITEALTARILVLGAGATGKSSIEKQLRQLYIKPYTSTELMHSQEHLTMNIIVCIRRLAKASKELSKEKEYKNTAVLEKNEKIRDYFLDLHDSTQLTGKIVQDIKTLRDDPGIQETWNVCGHKYHLLNNSRYLLSDKLLNKIDEQGWEASVEDMIHARRPTTGIVRYTLDWGASDDSDVKSDTKIDINAASGVRGISGISGIINNSVGGNNGKGSGSGSGNGNVMHDIFGIRQSIEMYDMGGTRNGRRKWFHVIENVSVVIFTVSLIEYSQVLWEDTRKNRMKESLELLTGVLNFEPIHHCPIVVVFSHVDLLEQRLKNYPIVDYFDEYLGDNSVDDAIQFFTGLMDKQAVVSGGKVDKFYMLNLMDKQNVKNMFEDVVDRLL